MDERGESFSRAEEEFMRRALVLAQRGYGGTSPNPMVGAVLVRGGKIVSEGWHKKAGEPHAEVNAINAARRKGVEIRGATFFVTLEPCSTTGRTPPCTGTIIENGIREVVVAARDPNPNHAGAGLKVLQRAGVNVRFGLFGEESNRMNEAFNHWIVKKTPWVTLKCAMSLDGKIATNTGESKWITGVKAREAGMRLRAGADAIIAGINTVLRDDPALTVRNLARVKIPSWKKFTRIILDPEGRIPLNARVLADESQSETIVVVTDLASSSSIHALEKVGPVIKAPLLKGSRQINLRRLLRQLGRQEITSVLVEGGGETHFNFLRQSLVNRVCFFYAPMVITGRAAPKATGGKGTFRKPIRLEKVEWSQVGVDLLCTGLVKH